MIGFRRGVVLALHGYKDVPKMLLVRVAELHEVIWNDLRTGIYLCFREAAMLLLFLFICAISPVLFIFIVCIPSLRNSALAEQASEYSNESKEMTDENDAGAVRSE